MSDRQLYVTKHDKKRLEELLEVAGSFGYKDRADLESLAEELESAKIVDPTEIPPDVITMNSRVRFRDVEDGKSMEVTLVFPGEANIDAGRISVLSPIGTALLGYGEGDTVEWQVPAKTRRILIEKVLYQPERAGNFDL